MRSGRFLGAVAARIHAQAANRESAISAAGVSDLS